MPVFSNAEKIDIVAVYREANNNALEARRRYAQRYPERRLPSRAVFARTEVTLRVHGTFHPPVIGNKRVVDDPELRRAVVNQVEDNPHVGQRGIAATLETSRKSVGRILKSGEFHPFKVHLTQELHGDDFRNRVNFCTFMLQQPPNFQQEICWSDESNFSNEGVVNRHNMHYYSIENPHWTQDRHIQGGWSLNVWAGILGTRLIGPHFFEGPPLNGQRYHAFLQNDLEHLLHDGDVPLDMILRRRYWLQQDGAPPHWARVVRDWLDEVHPQRWIGRGGPVAWPPRSPDLTPLDFFLWGYVKARVYHTRPDTREELQERIRNAFETADEAMLTRVHQSALARYQRCIQEEGRTFEHLL